MLRRHRSNPGQIKLFACAARVFVQLGGDVAGEEALVFRDGGVVVSTRGFLNLLKSFPTKYSVTVEADNRVLAINGWGIRVTGYVAQPAPPADFVVGCVTDAWLAQPSD